MFSKRQAIACAVLLPTLAVPAATATPGSAASGGGSDGQHPASVSADLGTERNRKHPVVKAAGDIACSPADSHYNGGKGEPGWCRQRATSDLLSGPRVARVLTLGDNQYEEGTLGAFRTSYHPSWGRYKSITSPAVGNHEYRTPGAAGYFEYFGGRAGAPSRGYYSFDIGAWHLIALNSECTRLPVGSGAHGCAEGSPQNDWLETDLRKHRSRCTLAYWHIPPSFGAQESKEARIAPMWRDLYRAGTDVALTGHRHTYSRYAPVDGRGVRDGRRGIRQFIVGTGGKNHGTASETAPPTLQMRQDHTFGVLRLALHPGSYAWRFLAERGETWTDTGSTACH